MVQLPVGKGLPLKEITQPGAIFISSSWKPVFYKMDNKLLIPPGWDYNPSSWKQRLPLIIIAIVGFFIALYMGLFQLKVLDSVWDPFFGEGTRFF